MADVTDTLGFALGQRILISKVKKNGGVFGEFKTILNATGDWKY